MKTEKIIEILTGRLNKLTDFEKEWMCENSYGWYNRYLFKYDKKAEEYSDAIWEGMWCYSAFGQHYLRYQDLAKKFLSSEKKMNYVMDMMDNRKCWHGTNTHVIKNLHTTGKLTQNIVAFMIPMMRRHNLIMFESYVNDPIYSVGEIVQFRSSMGADSILMLVSSSGGKYYYGCGKSQLKRLRNKTFMIIQIDPEIDGKNYANVYSYHEKQGGSRIYKVLPIGSAETYFVVEKFLKKCRTKAVKDARK